jgi:DNA (cytosine-5)-methyltransferase 1
MCHGDSSGLWISSRSGVTNKVNSHVSGTLSELDMQVVKAVPPGGNWRDLPDDFPSQRVKQIREGSRNGGGSRSTYYGRLRLDRPAYTVNTFITRPGNGCFIHPTADRLLTLREAARLQSFPDSSSFAGPIRAQAMQIGNAVPPLLAYHLARMVPRGPVVDLFCGAGGMSIGFEMAGHEIVAAADNNRHAVSAAKSNAADPGTVSQLDLSDIAVLRSFAREAKKRAPNGMAALVGGPPCQGFSTAGPCRIEDERNHLVRTFLTAVKLFSPSVVIMENVPALMWRGRAFLTELIDALVQLGYNPDVALLHAEAYGVPQLRRRLIVMASKHGEPKWPEPTHQLHEPSFPRFQPTSVSTRKLGRVVTVKDAIGDLPLRSAAHLDELVPLAEPRSDFQRWSRDLIGIKSMAPRRAAAGQYVKFANGHH